MTISSVTSKIVYVGDESTTVFPYPFRILEDTDLVVTRFNTSTSSTDILVLNTNYAVSGAGDSGGGNVTLTGSAVQVSLGYHYVHTGNELVIQRTMPLTQETDYVANDPFSAETHEEALDRLCMSDQQLQEQINRCIKAPINQATGNTTYAEVVNASVASASSSAAVCVSAATGAVDVTVSVSGNATSAAASAVQASLSAASVSSGVTAALDNLTPTAINEALVPGSSNYISLGSATKSWSSAYVWATGHITTVRSTLLSGATLNVSGTADAVTLRATMLTSTTLNVSGTSNVVTLGATLLSATTLNISGTANITSVTGIGFIDRGDPSATDYDQDDLTCDGSPHDLDLSAIVPPGAKAVVLSVYYRHGTPGSYIQFRENGNGAYLNTGTIYAQVNGIYNCGDFIIACDSGRVIEYITTSSPQAILIIVKGWFM